MIDIRITPEPLDIRECIENLLASDCGGIDLFIGRVRAETLGNKVVQLEFEAYQQMALNELNNIAEYAVKNWHVKNIVIHHRTGILSVGDVPVIIAVSAEHRDAAFDACRYIIDTLKQSVPIWKKEIFEGGAVWVAAHP
jgi:molybdopterin synthase catalytic subunit